MSSGQRARRKDPAEELARLRSRLSVRAALKVARVARGPVRAGRWLTARFLAGGRAEMEPRERALALLRNMRECDQQPHGHRVSVIVTTPVVPAEFVDALEMERRDCRSLELIVGKTMTGIGLTDDERALEVRFVPDQETDCRAFLSRALAAATGDSVLVVSDIVMPVNRGWLSVMIEALEDEFDRVVSPLIVTEHAGGRAAETYADVDFLVASGEVGFGWAGGAPTTTLGVGASALDAWFARVAEVPALGGRCLLALRDTMRNLARETRVARGSRAEVLDGVDLCLRARARGGSIVMCGQAVLLDLRHEYEDRIVADLEDEASAVGRARATRRMVDDWGPPLARTLRIDALTGQRVWNKNNLAGQARHAAIVTTEDPELAQRDRSIAEGLRAALTRNDWSVTVVESGAEDLPSDLTLMIALTPSFEPVAAARARVNVAWIHADADRWLEKASLDAYEVVAVASEQFATVLYPVLMGPHPCWLPLATRGQRFTEAPALQPLAADAVFVGTAAHREELATLLPDDLGDELLVVGDGWPAFHEGADLTHGFVSDELLPSLYSSAKLVIDHTRERSRPALNERVFDALAAGTLPITDNPQGVGEVLGAKLPTYGSRADLRTEINSCLDDSNYRRSIVKDLQNRVLEGHTYDDRAAHLLAYARRQVRKPKVAFKVCATNRRVAEQWGDTHLARAMARALSRQGFASRLDVRPEWNRLESKDSDIVVHLRGRTPFAPFPASLNILWIISHPSEVTVEECEQFDLVFTASESFARELASRVSVPVHVLLQATDVHLFKPGPVDPEITSDLLFVGNTRGMERRAVRWALESDLPLTVYGEGWDGLVPPDALAARHAPNHHLPALYRSSRILVNDHWDDMLEHGFVSNRLFDALACGSFVISDGGAVVEELFEGAVPTYRTKEEFAALVEKYTGAGDERTELVRHGCELVHVRHSFDERARTFLDIVEPLLADRLAGFPPWHEWEQSVPG